MLRLFIFLWLVILSEGLICQISFTESNLPILIIETEGSTIFDEPKVSASLKLIYNSEGNTNYVTDTSYDYNGKIGIELRGQTSQSLFPKKSYGFETQDASGQNNNVSLLGMPKENDWVLHGPYSDKTLIRNALTYIMASKVMTYAPRVRFCEMIINDEYLGVYLLTEKIKRDKNRVNISKLTEDEVSGDGLTGGYILKMDKTDSNDLLWESNYSPIPGRPQKTRFVHLYPKKEDIQPNQIEYIRTFINDFEKALVSDNYRDAVNGYKKYIDVNSFINLILMNEVTKNLDSYRISTYMYKDRDSIDSRLKMGPVWDYNLAYGNANFCRGERWDNWALHFNQFCPDDYWVNHFWWNRFLSDTTFTNQMEDRWFELRETTFSNENWNFTIDSLISHLGNAIDRNFAKWNVTGEHVWPNSFVGQTFDSDLNYLRNWIRDRLIWMDNNISRLSTIQVVETRNPIIYPNPSQGLINVEIPASHARWNAKFKVFDMLGRTVYEKALNPDIETFDFEILTSGIYYYVVILNDNNILTNSMFVISN